MGMKLFGNWDAAEKLFGSRSSSKSTMDKACQVGLRRTLAYYEGQVKKNIRSSGTLADKPFAPNAPSTIKRKGSSKPLMDSGEMLGSIHPVVVVPGKKGFVGIKKGTIYDKTGEEVSDIAAIHEFGAIGEGKTEIQARPFLGPVLEKFKDESGEVFLNSIKEALNGND